jgi:hypothetical protein
MRTEVKHIHFYRNVLMGGSVELEVIVCTTRDGKSQLFREAGVVLRDEEDERKGFSELLARLGCSMDLWAAHNEFMAQPKRGD